MKYSSMIYFISELVLKYFNRFALSPNFLKNISIALFCFKTKEYSSGIFFNDMICFEITLQYSSMIWFF